MPDPAPFSLRADDAAEIGGYRLIGRLGAGGQGTVYLAEPAQGGARVAIKTLSPEGLDDPRVRQRFVREAEAARQVASFCTAAVLAADFDAESPYIVSEYVEGRSLGQRIREGGPMAGGDLSRLAVATATALVAIHEAGIVHRDVKPGNVLLGDGGARVIDFGIAQTDGAGTQTSSRIGTPAFMAPEQIAHGNATPASDVFAWGVILVYAATGASPFNGGTVPNVLHNVLHVEPDLSALPAELRRLVAGALAKDPAARPSAVDVLMTLLGRQGRPTGVAGLNQAMREAHTAAADGGGGAPPVASPPPWNTPYGGPPAHTSNSRVMPWLVGIGAVLVAGALVVAVVAGMLLGNVLEPAESSEGNGGGGSGPQADDGGGGDAESEDSGGDAESEGDGGDAESEGGGAEASDDTEGEDSAPAEESTSIYDVEVGDCYDEPLDEDMSELLLIDCAEPHEAEVYGLVQLDGDRGWPGESVINSEAEAECEGEVFESYVGIDYYSSIYHMWYYPPTEADWNDGDYEVVCSAHDPDGKITGSVAGSGE